MDVPALPSTIAPADRMAGQRAYQRKAQRRPISLRLDANEGSGPVASLLGALADDFSRLASSYPDASRLESLIAERIGVPRECVLATAGADDALDRLCRVMLQPGRRALMTRPTFEMLPRFVRSAGAEFDEVAWLDGAFPTRAMAEAITPDTSLIFVVSPNNPTGGVATVEDLRDLRAAAPSALIVLDHAYVEFADEDLTLAALQIPGVAITRTLSKAWGFAGMRVGYLIAHPEVMQWAKRAGLPYALSGVSIALAERYLSSGEHAMCVRVRSVRAEVQSLTALLASLNVQCLPSQANFVFARFANAPLVADMLAGLGISVRAFPDLPDLADYLRIGCPGDNVAFDTLANALRAVLAPQAILFDLDGVLADVSQSYRRAIIDSAATYGVTITREQIGAAKAAGNANNDWVLTQRLLAAAGVEAPLDQVTARFESIYQGTPERPGLRASERLLTTPQQLREWADQYPLAIVTGRPRRDAELFLSQHGVLDCFQTLVCMEDATVKPDPAPVRLALKHLNVTSAWMIGDTVDDIRSSRGAGVVPIGVIAPGEDPARADGTLTRAGAARVLPTIDNLSEILP